MPYTDKTKSAQWQRDYQRRKRLQGRTCEGCGERPAETYYRASEQTRTWVLCSICRLALLRAKPKKPRVTRLMREDAVAQEPI